MFKMTSANKWWQIIFKDSCKTRLLPRGPSLPQYNHNTKLFKSLGMLHCQLFQKLPLSAQSIFFIHLVCGGRITSSPRVSKTLKQSLQHSSLCWWVLSVQPKARFWLLLPFDCRPFWQHTSSCWQVLTIKSNQITKFLFSKGHRIARALLTHVWRVLTAHPKAS